MNSGNISKKDQTQNFDNLKSNFILRKLFNILKENKSLNIMKYNKKLQKRLNININDYKEYSQIYSSIQIELKIADNKSKKYKLKKFINILDKDRKYYHIYFNDSKEEKKRNYLRENEKVNIIKIIIEHQVESFKKLFDDCEYISSIVFKKFSRINITDMSYMFSECSSLNELNLSNFNTNNVTNMSCMFYECSSLKELNLSSFNTNNVINMSCMFYGCSLLKELNISSFNTNKVTNMESMFSKCSILKELNISNFNTNKVTNMSFMFAGCSSLKELNLSNFNTNNVKYIGYMFYGCSDELIKKIKEQNKNLGI